VGGALRVVAWGARRDRSIQVISLEAEPSPDGSGLFQTMPLSVHVAVERDGGTRAAEQIRAGCGHCDAVLLILPPMAETGVIVNWARLADSTILVVDGRRPEQAPCLRALARLRDAGVAPAGVVAVAT
jgi:hypothetical protein